MRSQITSLAHALRKAGLSWAESMKRAWAAISIKIQSQTGGVSFFYLKEDGSERYTIANQTIAPGPVATTKPAKPQHPLVVKYYDLLADGWRSFRADRLILD